jgi:hypothetical protein
MPRDRENDMCFAPQRKVTIILCSPSIQKIWWQTAASSKCRPNSHSISDNSGTEEFQIWLWNYLTSQRKDLPSVIPTSLDVKKPWFSFLVLITLFWNMRIVNNRFKPCKPHMAYCFTNIAYILMNEWRKTLSYKEVCSFYSQTPKKIKSWTWGN